jgi:hypothetical protein
MESGMRCDENPFVSPAEDTTRRKPPAAVFASGHTRAVLVFMCVGTVVCIRTIGAGLCVLGIRLANRDLASRDAFAGLVTLGRAASLVVIVDWVASIISAALFMAWFYRAYSNLRALGRQHLEYSPVWTIASWFTPAANLIMPCLIMTETVRGSVPRRRGELKPKRVPGLLAARAWWVMWLAMTVLSLYVPHSARGDTEEAAVIRMLWFSNAANLFAIPTGILTILVVRIVDVNQEQQYCIVQEEAAIVKPEVDESLARWFTAMSSPVSALDDSIHSPEFEQQHDGDAPPQIDG